MEQTLDAQSQVSFEPAGFWLRGGALVIDNLLVTIVSGVLGGVLGLVGVPQVLRALLNLAIAAGYFTWWPLSYEGQTIGKRLAGLSIVRNDGAPLTAGSLFLRWLGYMASALTLGLGYLMALFTENKRALQDFIGGTRVVVVEPKSGGRKAIVVGAALLVPLAVVLGILAAVAVPKLAQMQGAAQDAVAKTSLVQMRTAAQLYAAENKTNPKDLSLLMPKYVPQIPELEVAGHAKTAAVTVYGPEACSGSRDESQTLRAGALKDTGGWGYVVAPGAACDGALFVDCTQQSSEGKDWYRY